MSIKPLISVIVPVYNVAPYLEQCMESIVGQTYANLEIILVDDGSTDGSDKICDTWANKDKRVTVLHKENGGLSSARNSGLRIAAGDYIGYVDSDDCIAPTMYETLMRLLEENAADVVKCQFESFRETPSGYCHTEKFYAYTGRDMCNKILGVGANGAEPKVTFCVWNGLYKAETAKKVMFEEGVYYEDVMYTFNVLWNLNKVIFYEKALYFYRLRGGSTTNVELTDKHAKDALNYITRLYTFYLEKGTKGEIALSRGAVLDHILKFRCICPPNLKAEYKMFTCALKEYNLSYKDVQP